MRRPGRRRGSSQRVAAHFAPRKGATVNSANFAQLRNSEKSRWPSGRVQGETSEKKSRPGVGGQGSGGGGRRGWCAFASHTHITHTRTSFASSAIPGTFSPKLAVASRRGDYKSAAIPSSPSPPPPGPMQHTTLAYHAYFVPEHFMSARLAVIQDELN